MVLIDSSLLIAIADPADAHYPLASKVFHAPETFATSTVAWAEFNSHPLEATLVFAIRKLLRGGILPFTEEMAERAGTLVYEIRPKRTQRMDTMIAATAICLGAELATANLKDFRMFQSHGPKIVKT